MMRPETRENAAKTLRGTGVRLNRDVVGANLNAEALYNNLSGYSAADGYDPGVH